MPGGGTPALEPINTPALDCAAAPGSNACAGDHDSAITPAAANRALQFNFMCPPFLPGNETGLACPSLDLSAQEPRPAAPEREVIKALIFVATKVPFLPTRAIPKLS